MAWCYSILVMRILVFLLAFCIVGCGASQQEADEPTSSQLEPIITTELPDPIPEVPASKRVVEAAKTCEVEAVEGAEWRTVGPGIFMSYEMSKRAAQLRIDYDEIRGSYEVDIRTVNRAQAIYQKQLDAADADVVRLRKAARRSWWELNRGLVGLAVGVVVGAGLAVGILAATEGVKEKFK